MTRPPSEDTDPRAEAVWIDLIRSASGAKRFRTVRSLSATVIRMAWRAIREERPDASEDELRVEFVRLHYGEDLAQRLKRYLAERSGEAAALGP